MRAEWWIVNEMKEKVSFVSSDFARDLEACWKGTRPDATLSSSEARQRDIYRLGSNGIACDYVLPDFSTRLHGEVRPYDPTVTAKARRMAAARGGGSTEDVLTLRNERFTVPELLFHPSDSGLGRDMAGLADAAMDSLSCLPVGLWPAMLANVVIVGGNACIPGLVERLQKELLVRAPDECVVRVASPADPVGYCWKGGRNMVRQCLELVEKLCVTKQEYEEYGGLWTARRFAAGLEVPG